MYLLGDCQLMYRLTYELTADRCIGCCVRYSVDSQPRCRSRDGRRSTKYPPTSRLRVVFLSVECQPTDSISSMLAMYRCILGQVLVRYRWCIGWQSALPTVGWYVDRVMFNSRSRISQQNRLTFGHDIMGSVLPVYRWTVGWLSVRYSSCISRQSLSLYINRRSIGKVPANYGLIDCSGQVLATSRPICSRY